jgi:hypothetical protein
MTMEHAPGKGNTLLKNEIRDQLSYIREWGGKFVVPIPEVEVF